MNATAGIVVQAMYRNHLESYIRTAGGTSINFLELFKDMDFCKLFVERVLDPDFINNQLIGLYCGGSHTFVESIAYLYERMRPMFVTTKHATVSHFSINDKQVPVIDVGMKSAADHWEPFASANPKLLALPLSTGLNAFLALSLPIQWPDIPENWAPDEELHGISFVTLGRTFNTTWVTDGDWATLIGPHINAESPTFARANASRWYPAYWYRSGAIYGVDMINWLNGKANTEQYSDIFNIGTPRTDGDGRDPLTRQDPPSFLAPRTMVRTDNDDVPIESLGTHSRVLTRAQAAHGTASDHSLFGYFKLTHSEGLASNLPVMVTTTVDARGTAPVLLYGMNDQTPFFTAGQIFFTKAGPKAIQPDIARKENPQYLVGTLSVGDVLFRLKAGSATPGYEEVPVKSLVSKPAYIGFLYGLDFGHGGEGGFSYHANGYLVASAYPEMTMERLQQNYLDMPIQDQVAFSKKVC
jgi:hypothetical protein